MSIEDLGLTEAELEAIKGDDEDVTEEVVDENEAEDDPVEEVSESEPETEGEADADEPAGDGDASSEEAPRATEFTAESTDGLEGQLTTLGTELDTSSDALAAKYESGDLSFSEYRKQDRAMQAEYDQAKQGISEALLTERIAAEHSKQSAEQTWQAEQDMFFADNEIYKTDPILRGALGAQLDTLYADSANEGKSGLWYLREAGKAIDERFNRAPADASSDALALAKDKQRKKAAEPVPAPRTLGDVPAAEANIDAGEFAAVDKMQGIAYEEAIAAMSPTTYERFMAS